MENFWICLLSPAISPSNTLADLRMPATLVNRDEKEDRGRGNKGLMSLAKRGWRLRQMAWSLQHSGMARLVLKSSSLTFQQILPGGWGVCHTTLRIHAALYPLPPTPKKYLPLLPQPNWPLRITFLLFYPRICIRSQVSTYWGGSFGLLQAC